MSVCLARGLIWTCNISNVCLSLTESLQLEHLMQEYRSQQDQHAEVRLSLYILSTFYYLIWSCWRQFVLRISWISDHFWSISVSYYRVAKFGGLCVYVIDWIGIKVCQFSKHCHLDIYFYISNIHQGLLIL